MYARALLKATTALRWKLSTGKQADVFRDIAELAGWIASGNERAHQPQVEDLLARHFTRVDALRDPNDVARAWGRQREELLTLMR